jgi:hypothetical protein
MTYTQVWDAMQNKVSDNMILRDYDQAFIPFDDKNRDYQEYKAWLDEGHKPKQAKPPEAPPATSSKR